MKGIHCALHQAMPYLYQDIFNRDPAGPDEDLMARLLGDLGDYGERPPARRTKRKKKPVTSMRADLIEAAGLLLASLGQGGGRDRSDVFRNLSRGITDRAAPAQSDGYEPFKTFPIRESDHRLDPIEGLFGQPVSRPPAPAPYGDSADIADMRTFSRPRIGYASVVPELPPRVLPTRGFEPRMVEQPSAAERRAINARKAEALEAEFQAWLRARKVASARR